MGGLDLAVVLVRTEGPINLGLCARACRNLGIDRLRLVAPRCAIDCDDTRRFANHAIDFLRASPVHAALGPALADRELVIGTTARPRGEAHGPVYGPADLQGLVDDRGARRVALVFGNEQHGLDAAELRRCHALLRLATPGDYPSYNLSHAVAIAGYHLRTGGVRPAVPAAAPVPQERLDQLIDYWLASLDRFGYFRRTTFDRFAPKLRRLFQDLRLKAHDTELFFGMLAQFHHRCFGDKGHHLIEPLAGGEPAGPGAAAAEEDAR